MDKQHSQSMILAISHDTDALRQKIVNAQEALKNAQDQLIDMMEHKALLLFKSFYAVSQEEKGFLTVQIQALTEEIEIQIGKTKNCIKDFGMAVEVHQVTIDAFQSFVEKQKTETT